MILLALLVACVPPDGAPTPPPPTELAAANDTAPEVEVLPGSDDTGLAEAPRAPGLATITCPEAIPVEGKVSCTLRLADADGAPEWAGPVGVGIHGRSSAEFPKPQYAVELRDDAGLDAPADLFGMGEEADWLLNGMYVDRALLRNKIAYDLFRDLTHDHDWAPESVYVEVVLGGDYLGLFTLVERIDRADGRTPVAPDDGTGAGFIVKAAEAGIPSTLQYGLWEVVYPPAAAQTPEVLAEVTARLARMEALVAARDVALWDELDLDSAVAFVLLEEAFKNNDAFYLSHHLYAHVDGKLHFAPWDLDLSLGQPNYNDNENPASWLAYRPEMVLGLAGVPGFTERLVSMWAEWRREDGARRGGLADAAFDDRVFELVRALGPATGRNFERWPIGEVQFGHNLLYAVGSHDEELTRVTTFAHARFAWMDANVATWGDED